MLQAFEQLSVGDNKESGHDLRLCHLADAMFGRLVHWARQFHSSREHDTGFYAIFNC